MVVKNTFLSALPGMSDWTYEARCKELKLPTLKQRRLRGDLIETYKILNGHEGADYTKFFELDGGITRGHNWKLKKREHITSQVREGWFSFKVVNPWKNLPKNVVDAPSIKTFKTRLDEFLDLS